MATTFRTITYTEFNPGEKKAILFIPSVSKGNDVPDKLISSLPKDRTVIYIHSGYYGNNKSNAKNQSLYSQDHFVQNLHDLMDTKDYKEITILAGSVGAIHALELFKHDPQKYDALIMGAPAFRKNKPFSNFIYVHLINLLLLLNPDFLFSIYLKLISLFPSLKVIHRDMVWINDQIGARSYLLCLKEIILYSKKRSFTKEIIRTKGSIILGSRDQFFNLLCDRQLCNETKCVVVDSGHGVLNSSPKEMAKIIKDFYTSLQGSL